MKDYIECLSAEKQVQKSTSAEKHFLAGKSLIASTSSLRSIKEYVALLDRAAIIYRGLNKINNSTEEIRSRTPSAYTTMFTAGELPEALAAISSAFTWRNHSDLLHARWLRLMPM